MWKHVLAAVRGANGKVIQQTFNQPDHNMIAAQVESCFFVQLAVETGGKARVAVMPLANRVDRKILSKSRSKIV